MLPLSGSMLPLNGIILLCLQLFRCISDGGVALEKCALRKRATAPLPPSIFLISRHTWLPA